LFASYSSFSSFFQGQLIDLLNWLLDLLYFKHPLFKATLCPMYPHFSLMVYHQLLPHHLLLVIFVANFDSMPFPKFCFIDPTFLAS
jgi:hypothetical protein